MYILCAPSSREWGVAQREAVGITGVAVAWGAIGLMVRAVDLPAAAIVGARCSIAAVTLGIFFAVRKRIPVLDRLVGDTTGRTSPLLLLGLGALLGVHWLCLVSAQQRAPLGTVLFITYLAPIVVAALARRVVNEHVPARTVGALVVALVGIALLARPGSANGVGLLFALLAALTYGVLTLGSKRAVVTIGGVRLALIQMTTAAVVLAPLSLSAHWGSPHPKWLWLVVLGVVFTAFLSPAFLALLRRLPVATVGVLSYVEPVSATVLAWLVLHEVPSALSIFGGAMVLAAGIMVTWTAAPTSSGATSLPG
jgi:drug/metabolite transporter (DMT)-like permease